MKRSHYGSGIAFNDLLFNLLVGFVFLFTVAFILINPQAKKNDIPSKAEYLFAIEWDSESYDDIDIWVRDPNGITVSFLSKDGGLLNLERDDLGKSNDTYESPDGTETIVKTNREVTTMRGIIPGTYTVMAHVFNKYENKNNPDPYSPLSFKMIRVNPYQEVYTSEHRYKDKGQIVPILQFDLDENGKASNFRFPTENIVIKSNSRISGSLISDTFVSGGLQKSNKKYTAGSSFINVE
jgi:hypothetical protein